MRKSVAQAENLGFYVIDDLSVVLIRSPLCGNELAERSRFNVATDDPGDFEEQDIERGLLFELLFVQLHLHHPASQIAYELSKLTLAHFCNSREAVQLNSAAQVQVLVDVSQEIHKLGSQLCIV